MSTNIRQCMLATFLVVAALGCVSPAYAAARLALVIGNDAYVSEFRLPSCVNDARRMAKWLETVGYDKSEVQLLTDAKRDDMLAALETLAKQAETQHPEQVFFYFSGHGLAIDDDNGDEGDGDSMDEALVAIDDPLKVDSVEKILVRDDLFYDYVSRIAKTSGQVFILMDCCYSGGLAKALPKSLEGFKGTSAKAKFIHADEIAAYIAGQQATKGMFKVPEAQSKSIGLKGTIPREIKRIDAKQGVIFLSASNQFQLSRAGEPLSAFTDAFIKTVEQDRERLTTAHGTFTLALLRSELASKLYDVPQSPVLECQPPDLALDKDPFIPGLFPTPAKWEEEQHATGIVAQLLALPEETRVAEWKLEVTPTRQPPIAVGQQFALNVKSSAKGHLVMFTVGASGQVTFLYPNRYRLINDIAAEGSAVLPYKDGLKVQPPVGAETFYVYLLERNPFKNFDFGKTAGAMTAGDLEGILRQNPALRTRVSHVAPADLGTTRTRGMAVERVANALRAEGAELRLFSGPPPRWTSAVVQVQTKD